MAELHVQRKRHNYSWLWTIFIIVVIAVAVYGYLHTKNPKQYPLPAGATHALVNQKSGTASV